MKIEIGDARISSNQRLTDAYATMLKQSGSWTLSFHVSFRKAPTYEWAKKRFKWFFKTLNTNKKMYFENYIRCWVFYERHKSGRIHIHALIDRINPEHALNIQGKAKGYFGDYSQVESYDPLRGMAHYLAKKIGKDSLVEYEFYVINSKIRFVSKHSNTPLSI